MQINLYINYSEKNKMVKTLSNGYAITGTLRSESSIINPIIIIEHENPSLYNYMQIPEFNYRYYFINDITSLNTNVWRLAGHVDVLTSNISDLKKSLVIIEKGGIGDSNLYYDDQSWILENRTFKRIFNFPKSLPSTPQNILIVAGKSVIS